MLESEVCTNFIYFFKVLLTEVYVNQFVMRNTYYIYSLLVSIG